MIQAGKTSKIDVSISPKGFQSIAPVISPFRIDRTDLVEPQEGQGIPVAHLNKQTPGSNDKDTFRW
jgi:hypothetical protein